MKWNSSDLEFFLQQVSQSIDSKLLGHRFDADGALLLEFDLQKNDPRLLLFCKLIPGKWRPPATYRITSFEFSLQNLWEFFGLVKSGVNGPSSVPLSSCDALRDVVFQEIAHNHLTLREVAQKSGLTEMSLYNYKKKANLRLDSWMNLLNALHLSVNLTRTSAHQPNSEIAHLPRKDPA